MTLQSTYLLAPNLTFRPDSGPIQLGALIADPFRPHRVLSTVDASAIATRYPPVEGTNESERQVERSISYDTGVAVWAQFLEIVGPRLSGERARGSVSNYTTESLLTEYFLHDPTDDEIIARISESKVRAVMKAEGFGFAQPVYMVTGRKVAHGLAVKREAATSMSTSLEGTSGPLPIPAGTLDMGVKIGGGKSIKAFESWKSNDDIVFAYQLLKIELRGLGKQKRLRIDEFRDKAAFLDMDGDVDGDASSAEDDFDQDFILSRVSAADLLGTDEAQTASVAILGSGGSQVEVVSFPLKG